jgi:Ca-activated chloride channel homolog
VKFVYPAYLFFCGLCMGIVFFYVWSLRRRRKVWGAFVQKELEPALTMSVSFGAKKVRAALIISCIALVFLALMRPQWGFGWSEAKRSGVDILLAFDTSKSMLAADILPNRFERSKLAVKDFVRSLKGDRVGLIAFSGSAFLQCPLTVDYGGFLLTLDDLKTDSIPRGGTDLSRAIRGALKAFESGGKKYKVLVIVSDGESHAGDALAAAQEAKREGVVIHCIGVGTKEGELISLELESGERAFLKDSAGNVVKSRLDESLLEKIALATEGSYIRATSVDFGLETLYREKISLMEKREFQGAMVKRYHERFQIPLFIAVLLLLIEPFIPDRKPAHRSTGQPANPRTREPAHPQTSLAACLIFFVAIAWASCAPAADSGTMARQGNKQYQAGKYSEALESYRAGLAVNPESEVLNFNSGAASYKIKDYPQAAGSFEKALLSDDSSYQARARYNLGDAKFTMGLAKEDADIKQAVDLVRQSLEHFRRAIEQAPSDSDAKYNYELAKKELKRLEEKQQQQQNQQQNQQQDQKKDQKQDQQKDQEKDQQKDQQQNQQQEQQNQQQQQNEQGQQQDQQSGQQEDQQQEKQQGAGQERSGDAMSQEEARQLLEGYDEEKSIQYLLDDKQGKPEGAVLKDW